MSFLGTTIAYMLRVNLSVAIVAMVNQTQSLDPESSYLPYYSIESDANSSSVCPGRIDPTEEPVKPFYILRAIFFILSDCEIKILL